MSERSISHLPLPGTNGSASHDDEPAVEIGRTVKTVRYAGSLRQRCVYTVHLSPPAGHAGSSSLAEFYGSRD